MRTEQIYTAQVSGLTQEDAIAFCELAKELGFKARLFQRIEIDLEPSFIPQRGRSNEHLVRHRNLEFENVLPKSFASPRNTRLETPLSKLVLDHMTKDKVYYATDIAPFLVKVGYNPRSSGPTLSQLARAGYITRVYHGGYQKK